MPPNNTNLERTYVGGTTVPFGTGSNYTCKEGTFFGSDFGKTHIAIECYRNGSWEAPGLIENFHYKYGLLPLTICTYILEIWDRCYSPSERFCFDPPPPPFNGGKYDWNTGYKGARTPYNTYVNYTCGPGRKLVKYTPNDTIVYDSIKLHCEWNRTWTPVGPVSAGWLIK